MLNERHNVFNFDVQIFGIQDNKQTNHNFVNHYNYFGKYE